MIPGKTKNQLTISILKKLKMPKSNEMMPSLGGPMGEFEVDSATGEPLQEEPSAEMQKPKVKKKLKL